MRLSSFLAFFSAGMGLHGFLLSSGFIDGGVTGISMLLAQTLRVPLPILILVINLPFVALGYRQVGRTFAIKSAVGIVGLSICLATVHFPDVTSDKLLTAVFGGFFLGAGMGLAMRGGAVLDGTDIAALLISKRSHIFRVGDVILGLEHRHLLERRVFSGSREEPLFDPDLCLGVQDARLPAARHRAIHTRSRSSPSKATRSGKRSIASSSAESPSSRAAAAAAGTTSTSSSAS